jgi:NADPH2:quinone reductase
VDYQIRKGLPEGRQVTSPILGRDFSGTVEAVHQTVRDFRPGDEVFGYVCNLASSGTYVEYLSVPEELVAKKPKSLTHDQAAAVPVAGITAQLALDRGRLTGAKSLFIAGGSGGVGSFAIVLAKLIGVGRLITTAGNPASRTYLMEKCGLGEAEIVNYRDVDFVEQALRRNGGWFDCVLDFVGGQMLSACCRLIGLDGHLASITEAPGPEDFEYLFQRNASFQPVGANAYSLVEDRTRWRIYRTMLEDFARLFDTGKLAAPQVRNLGAFSAETVRKAHDMLERSAAQGKLVMTGP